MDEKRAAFEAIQGADEQAVRQRFAVLGLTPERVGVAEFEEAVRGEVERLELQGSTPLESLRSVTKRTEIATKTPQKAIEVPPKTYACEACHDERFVLTTTRKLDDDIAIRADPIACPRCVPLESRALIAGVDERFLSARLEGLTKRKGNEAAVDFARKWDGQQSVVIASRTQAGDSTWGTGKTHLATAMLIGQIERGRPGRFMYAKDFLDGMKALFGGDSGAVKGYVDRVAAEPLLVLDDLGGEQPTEWAKAEIRNLFDARYRKKLTTVVTTNVPTLDELAGIVGGAVASRMREFVLVKVGGSDMRSLETGRR